MDIHKLCQISVTPSCSLISPLSPYWLSRRQLTSTASKSPSHGTFDSLTTNPSATYIQAAYPKVDAIAPAWRALADASKGSDIEKTTSDAADLAKTLDGEWQTFKSKKITDLTDEDKKRIQADEAKIPEIKTAMDAINARTDLPAPIKAELTKINAGVDDMKAYGRGGLRPCFRDINTLRTAAQNSGLMPAQAAQRNAMTWYMGVDLFGQD